MSPPTLENTSSLDARLEFKRQMEEIMEATKVLPFIPIGILFSNVASPWKFGRFRSLHSPSQRSFFGKGKHPWHFQKYLYGGLVRFFVALSDICWLPKKVQKYGNKDRNNFFIRNTPSLLRGS